MMIGLCGKAGAGKDTVAQILIKHRGFTRYAFADAVRDAAEATNPLVLTSNGGDHERLTTVIDRIGWDRAKREVPEARRLLQVIGTEVGRQILGENCWVDIVNRKIKEDDSNNPIITDLRFENEQQYVQKKYGFIVQITRPDNPDSIAATHASEQFVPTPDFVINNDGSLETLEKQVLALHHYLCDMPKEMLI